MSKLEARMSSPMPKDLSYAAAKGAGYLLAGAALTFWLSWFLMPDQGTADTLHILSIVAANRDAVRASVIVQILSSALYVPALILLARALPAARALTVIGLVLLGIGAMGMAADAFFHLLAYFMTDPTVHLQPATVRVMERLQTEGLRYLLPLLLPFFVGTGVLARGAHKDGVAGKQAFFVVLVTCAVAVGGGVLVNKVLGRGRPQLVLIVLAGFAVAQLLLALNLRRGGRARDPEPLGRRRDPLQRYLPGSSALAERARAQA